MTSSRPAPSSSSGTRTVGHCQICVVEAVAAQAVHHDRVRLAQQVEPLARHAGGQRPRRASASSGPCSRCSGSVRAPASRSCPTPRAAGPSRRRRRPSPGARTTAGRPSRPPTGSAARASRGRSGRPPPRPSVRSRANPSRSSTPFEHSSRTPRPGPRERVPPDHLARDAELLARVPGPRPCRVPRAARRRARLRSSVRPPARGCGGS